MLAKFHSNLFFFAPQKFNLGENPARLNFEGIETAKRHFLKRIAYGTFS